MKINNFIFFKSCEGQSLSFATFLKIPEKFDVSYIRIFQSHFLNEISALKCLTVLNNFRVLVCMFSLYEFQVALEQCIIFGRK